MPITLQTDKPIAYDSPDHLFPFGTANDNSTDPIFNAALFSLIPAQDVRLLDIGCSGGGFVKSLLDAGGFAVGLEGSDYSKVRRRAEWATIPDHLFTADATVPFQFFEDGVPLKFNVITAWEFMEHIADADLDAVFENIRRHLAPQGIVLISVCPHACLHNGERTGEGVDLHLTTQSEDWWRERLAGSGFTLFDDLKSCFTNYVRGWPHEPDSPVLIFTTPQARQIPKVFHQVWLGGSPLPAEALAYQATWRQHHPDWEWRLWTEADLAGLESQWALSHAAHLSQKSDVIRYEVLRRFGGVYLDTDVECRRSIEPLLKDVTAFAGRERGDVICGAVLGGIAGHPLFEALVRDLPASMRAYTQCIEQAGPYYLSRVAYTVPSVTIFPPEIFYPYAWNELDRQGEEFSGAYAIHHWKGSWNRGGRATPLPTASSEIADHGSTWPTETLCWRGQELSAFPAGRHTEFQASPAKVSVCLPVFGPSMHLNRCVDSLQSQTDGNCQVLILAGSPEAFDVCAAVAGSYSNVIAYQSHDALSHTEGLNLCLALAAGEYVQFLSPSDELHSDCLTRQTATLDRYEHVVLSRTTTALRQRNGTTAPQPLFDRALHLPSESALSYALLADGPMSLLAPWMMRRTALTAHGIRFDTALHGAAGYDLVLRLLTFGDLAFSPQTGCTVDEGVAAHTVADRFQQFQELCRIREAAIRRTEFSADLLGRMAEQLARAHQSLGNSSLRGQTLGRILADAATGDAAQGAATEALLGVLQAVQRSIMGSHTLALAA